LVMRFTLAQNSSKVLCGVSWAAQRVWAFHLMTSPLASALGCSFFLAGSAAMTGEPMAKTPTAKPTTAQKAFLPMAPSFLLLGFWSRAAPLSTRAL